MHSEDKKNNSERICRLVEWNEGKGRRRRKKNVKVFTWNTFPTIYILNDTQKNKRIILYDNFMVQKILYPWEYFVIFNMKNKPQKYDNSEKFNRTNDMSNDLYYSYALLISLLLNNIFIYAIIFQISFCCCCWEGGIRIEFCRLSD